MAFEQLEKIKSLAIVGATGLVGREFLTILEEARIRIPNIKLLASERSAGTKIEFGGTELTVETLKPESFDGVEAAFFALPDKEVTAKFVPEATSRGCLVFDDSNTYRMQDDVPLVVPQVNGTKLKDFKGKIISTPNCSTTPVAMALKPLLDSYGLKRVIISTYQSVSGAGKRATEELSSQCASLLNGKETTNEVFPHQIAFNLIPRIGSVTETGYTDEETKVANELRKILDQPNLAVSATAVRVPTFCAHGVSVHVELERDFDKIETIRELMETFPGLRVLDQPASDIYPTNREAVGSNETFVGRIRRDMSTSQGITFWVMTDNLRKGAALNILEMAETYYGYLYSH